MTTGRINQVTRFEFRVKTRNFSRVFRASFKRKSGNSRVKFKFFQPSKLGRVSVQFDVAAPKRTPDNQRLSRPSISESPMREKPSRGQRSPSRNNSFALFRFPATNSIRTRNRALAVVRRQRGVRRFRNPRTRRTVEH